MLQKADKRKHVGFWVFPLGEARKASAPLGPRSEKASLHDFTVQLEG